MCVDIVKRLKIYMEHVGMPSTQFADYAKIARPTISQLLNGRNRKVSNELIEKLHLAFPDLNIMWLMFGDGDMEVNGASSKSDTPSAPNLFTAAPEQNEISPASEERKEIVVEKTRPLTTAEDTVDDSQTVQATPQSGKFEPPIQIPVTPSQGNAKRIQTIMVFYTDSSFEIFTPAH